MLCFICIRKALRGTLKYSQVATSYMDVCQVAKRYMELLVFAVGEKCLLVGEHCVLLWFNRPLLAGNLDYTQKTTVENNENPFALRRRCADKTSWSRARRHAHLHVAAGDCLLPTSTQKHHSKIAMQILPCSKIMGRMFRLVVGVSQ